MKTKLSIVALVAVAFSVWLGYLIGKRHSLPDGVWIGVPSRINGPRKFAATVRINGSNALMTPNLMSSILGVETGKWYMVTLKMDVDWALTTFTVEE